MYQNDYYAINAAAYSAALDAAVAATVAAAAATAMKPEEETGHDNLAHKVSLRNEVER